MAIRVPKLIVYLLEAPNILAPAHPREGDSAYKPRYRDKEIDSPTIIFQSGLSEGLARLRGPTSRSRKEVLRDKSDEKSSRHTGREDVQICSNVEWTQNAFLRLTHIKKGNVTRHKSTRRYIHSWCALGATDFLSFSVYLPAFYQASSHPRIQSLFADLKGFLRGVVVLFSGEKDAERQPILSHPLNDRFYCVIVCTLLLTDLPRHRADLVKKRSSFDQCLRDNHQLFHHTLSYHTYNHPYTASQLFTPIPIHIT